MCICLDYFIESHRVISYTSTVTCYPLKIKSLPLPLPLPLIPKGKELRLTVGWYFMWNSWSVTISDFRRTTTNSFPEFLFSQRDPRGEVEPQIVFTYNVISNECKFCNQQVFLTVMMHTRSLESMTEA